MDALPTQAIVRQWWDYMADLMATEPDHAPVQIALQPMFHLPERRPRMSELQVVDPHIHLWEISTHRYPWMEAEGEGYTGDISPIRRDYVVTDLLADAAAAGVVILDAVHIDANHDPADPVEETRWLQSLADAPGNHGLPGAIVAAADFSQPSADVEKTAGRALPISQCARHSPDSECASQPAL